MPALSGWIEKKLREEEEETAEVTTSGKPLVTNTAKFEGVGHAWSDSQVFLPMHLGMHSGT